jgi:S-adenosylmethionine/arginine decarboxylase-like enzyme
MVLHKHLIIRANVARPFVDVELTRAWLRRLVGAIGMKLCKSGGPHVDYVESEGNAGIAGVAMIETSHVSVHCWDREDPPLAQVDVYSCADYDPEVVLAFVQEMRPTSLEYVVLDRKDQIAWKKLPECEGGSGRAVSRPEPLGGQAILQSAVA